MVEEERTGLAKAVGADGYITKSSGLEAAVDTIRAALAANGPVKRRVLVVDDSEATARLLGAELTAQGHEVMSALSALLWYWRVLLRSVPRPSWPPSPPPWRC